MSQGDVGATDSPTRENGLGIAQNMAWNSVGNIVYLIAQWLLSYFVVRILGYGPAGIFSLAMSVGNSVCAVAAYSMRNYQASDIDNAYTDRQYILSRIVTSVISFVAAVVFVCVQSYGLETSLCVIGFSLFKISEAVSDVYQAIQQKHLRMDYVGKAYILKSVAEVVVFLAFLLVTGSLVVAVFALSIVSVVEIWTYERIVALRLSREDASQASPQPLAAELAAVRKLLVVCAPMAIYGVLFNTLVQVPRYQLQALRGDEVLGIYASVAMPIMLVQVAANYLFTPLTTPMARMYKDGETSRFVKMFMRVVAAIVIVSVVAFLVAALLGKPVYTLMYGESITDYLYLMYPLILCSVLTALSWFFANTLTILRKLGILLVGSCVAFVVALASGFPLIDAFGMNGASFACLAALGTFVVITGIGLFTARRSA